MKYSELSDYLIKIKARKDFYSLDGGLANDTLCISKINDGWEVYYTERGNKYNVQIYKNEEDACTSFLELLLKDERAILD